MKNIQLFNFLFLLSLTIYSGICQNSQTQTTQQQFPNIFQNIPFGQNFNPFANFNPNQQFGGSSNGQLITSQQTNRGNQLLGNQNLLNANQQMGGQQIGGQQINGQQMGVQQIQGQNQPFNPNLMNQNIQNIQPNIQPINQQLNNQQLQKPIGPFKWSSTLKSQDVTVRGNRVTADTTGSYKIFLSQTSLQKQCKTGCTNQFKINKNSGWFALGVCNKNTILANNFKWKKDRIGHGAYLFGSFGSSWSNYNQSQNDVMQSFKYTTGDIIRINFDPFNQEITFTKKGSSQYYILPYHWRDQQLHLCGIIYYAQDQVQYLGGILIQKPNVLPNDRITRELNNSKIIRPSDKNSKIQARNLANFFSSFRIKSLTLCYRASQNSFSASVFHTKCNNKGATLTLIEAQNGAKFGAYTPLSWDSSSTYGKDEQRKSFLFSLTYNEKFELSTHPQNAIFKHPNYGPTFGGGHDLHIPNNSNSSQGYCNFPHSYNALSYTGKAAQNRLCGGYNFKTKEYQVYVIILQ